jgi:hypothetical protein
MARKPQQQGYQGAGWPSQTEDAGNRADLGIFSSLGVSMGVVFEGVSGFARSAADLLPIAEVHGHGTAPAAHSSSKVTCAQSLSRQVSSRTLSAVSSRTRSSDSPRTSAQSKASTPLQRPAVARFGEAAGAYHIAETDSLPTPTRPTGILPSGRDGLRVPKDPCDKATHSKISSWMSKAEPAPPLDMQLLIFESAFQ